MLGILDRYVIREILPSFAIALLVFTFILEVPLLVGVAEDLIAKGIAWGVILRVMATLLPQALALTIPMGLLIGILIAFGRLSSDREAVALQACGVGLFRLLRPVALLAVLGCAATAYVMIVALPSANQTYREISYNVMAERAESEVVPRAFFEEFPGYVLYVRDTLPSGGWSDVFLARTDQGSQPSIYLAKGGRLVLDRSARTVDMVLERVTTHMVLGRGTAHAAKPEQPDDYRVERIERIVLSLDPNAVFPRSGPQKGDREMTIAELGTRIRQLRQYGESPHNPLMEIHKKFSIPAACLVFALVGLGLGVTSRRDAKLASFVLGIGVIFVYYVIMWTGQSMAKGHLLAPWLAVWLPNIVLGASGLVLVWWRSRSIERRVGLTLPFPFRVRRLAPNPPATVDADRAAPQDRGALVVIRTPALRFPRPSILDWYIGRLSLVVFALTFVGLLVIFYISGFIDLSDKLFKGTATTSMMGSYFFFATPQFAYYIIPLALLIAALVTIGLLTKHSELVVMKACGISLYRAAAPLLVLAVVSGTVLFALEENVLAYANRRAEAIRHVMRGGSPRTFDVLNRKWIVGKHGEIYHYVYFDPKRRELTGLSIFEFDPHTWGLARHTSVTQASYDPGGPAAFAASRWRGLRGWIREFGTGTSPTTYTRFTERDLRLEPPQYFVTEPPDAELMTYSQLRRHIADLSASGFNVVPYAVELHRKISFPFVTLIMTLIAVPFAVTTGRRGALYGVGAGILLAIGYWIATSVFAAIGSGGLIAPFLAAWAPNVLFGAGAVYLLLTVRT